MWARRCGAPPRWPSRVKVIFFSFFSGTIGLSLYMYMAGSNVSYLDLESPTSEAVLCLQEWPLRSHAISWSHPEEWVAFFDPGGPQARVHAKQKECVMEHVSNTMCARSVVPVHQMKRPLALAMSVDDTARYDVLGMWARFFLCITFAIWAGVTTHDLALVGSAQKHYILDVSGINQHCPSIRTVWRSLAGYRVLFRMVSQEKMGPRVLGIAMASILAPVAVAWNLVLFNFVIVPLILLAFARYPIRMSRAWVFIVCIACSLYGLVLAVQQAVFVFSPAHRPRYAVTWQPEAIEGLVLNATTAAGVPIEGISTCTCGCDYPVSFSVCVNLLIIGVLSTIKSIFLALRCLKGLRRSQWANLLSVLFPVPITVYSVDWKLPSGMPIRFRTEDVPVQGEVAFDPFAMMDEQLDSAFTTLHLRPEAVHRYERNDSGELNLVQPHRILETPAIPMPEFCKSEGMQVRKVEYIGCCGFPWPTGGIQSVYEPEFVEHLGTDVEGSPPTDSDKAGSNISHAATATGSTILETGVGLAAAGAVSIGKSTASDEEGDEEDQRGGCHLTPLKQQTQQQADGIFVETEVPRAAGCSGMVLAAATTPRQPAAHSPPVFEETDRHIGRFPPLSGEEVVSTKFSI